MVLFVHGDVWELNHFTEQENQRPDGGRELSQWLGKTSGMLPQYSVQGNTNLTKTLLVFFV